MIWVLFILKKDIRRITFFIISFGFQYDTSIFALFLNPTPRVTSHVTTILFEYIIFQNIDLIVTTHHILCVYHSINHVTNKIACNIILPFVLHSASWNLAYLPPLDLNICNILKLQFVDPDNVLSKHQIKLKILLYSNEQDMILIQYSEQHF